MTELNKHFTTRKSVVNTPLVQEQNNQVVTTSLIVAEAFGVDHEKVMNVIRSLVAQNQGREEIFMKGVYKDDGCHEHPMYYMNRVGFTFLAMRFSSERTEWFEIKFIEQFSLMERRMKERRMNKRNKTPEKPFYLKLAFIAAIVG